MLVAAAFAIGSGSAWGQATWNDTGNNTLWAVGTNWTNNTVGNGSLNVIFAQTMGSGGVNIGNTGRSVLSVGIVEPAGVTTWTMTNSSNAGTFTIASGSLTRGTSVTGTQTFAVPVILGTANAVTQSTWDIGGSGRLFISGSISGADAGNSLTKTGTGVLQLSGSNSFGGALTINQGTLSVATLNNGGAVGVTGTSSSLAANFVLGGGVLEYTGATASTDRSFTLTNATTSTIDVTTAATNLTFTGSSASTTGGLTKSGAGTLTLSGVMNYTGATTVSGGTLALGSSNRLNDATAVTLNGGAFTMGLLSDTVGGLTMQNNSLVAFSITGSTSFGSLSLGAGSLTIGAGTSTLSLATNFTSGSAVRYDLITYGSRSGTFNAVPSVPSGYRVVYGGTGAGTVSLAQVANQTFVGTAGTPRALVSTTVTVSGTLSNTSSSAAYAPLDVGLSGSSATSFLGFTPAQNSTVAGSSSAFVTGTLTALATAGTQNWSMVNTDSLAFTTSATASGSLQVVNQRSFAVTSSTVALGRYLITAAPPTGTTGVTSTGSNAVTASGTLGTFTTSNGLTLSLTSGSATFAGAAASQTAGYSVSGTATTAGPLSGSFSSSVGAEFGSIAPVVVNYTANPVNQRSFAVTSSTVALGRYLITAALPTGTTGVTSTGSNAITASGTLGTFTTSNGLTLSLASGSANFVGAAASQTAGYSVSGTATTAGLLSGSFSSSVGAEFGSIAPVVVNYTANPVDQRSFTSGSVALGRFLINQPLPTGTTGVTSTGSNATTASGTLGTFTTSNGLTLSLTSGSATFAGAAASQTAGYTVSGSAISVGPLSGSFSSSVGAEFGSIAPVVVNYTANAVNQRVFTTNTSSLSMGFLHQGATGSSATLVVTSTGLDATTASGTLGAFSGGPGGLTLGLAAGSAQFNGATTQSATFALSGTSLGVFTGTFTSAVAAELGTIPSVSVAVSGEIYSGLSTWSANGSGNWGTLAGTGASLFGANWQATQGSPGLDAGFTNADTATFGAALTSGSAAVSLAGANPSLKSLTFDNANSYAILPSGGGTQITLSSTGAALVTTLAGTHAIHTGLALASNATVDVAAGGRLEIYGVVSGTNGLTKTGASTLAIAGASTYTGPTTISSGTLQLGNGGTTGSLATASEITSDGVLAFNRSDTVTQGIDFSGGIIAGSGGLVQAGGGLLVLNAINSYTGPTSILSGTISAAEIVASQQGSNIGRPTANVNKLVNLANQGTLLYTGSTATFTRGFSLSSGGGGLIVQSPSTVLQMSGNDGGVTGTGDFVVGGAGQVSIISVLEQTGGLRYNGTGMLTLKGNNTFTGMTYVDSGTLRVDDTNGGGGRLAGSVTVGESGLLGGVGIIDGAIMGGGIVSPGNSPGVLTSGTYDPTDGGDLAFEFTLKDQEPSYNNPGSIQNDVLRLTGSAAPFTASLTSANVIDVYIASSQLPLQLYDYLEGGLFVDGMNASTLLLKVQNATFMGWVQTTGTGVRTFNGVNYDPITYDPEFTGLTVTTKYYANQNFGGGPVSGSVTQFIVVPEPGTFVGAAVAGVLVAGARFLRRRRRAA